MKWIYRHPGLYDVVDTLCSLSLSERVRWKVLGRLSADSLLEIGAGSGKNFRVAESGFKIALDVSPTMLAGALRRDGSVVAIIGDAHHLPFRDACIGVAVFSYCLRGLSRPAEAVREALRVAREVVVIDYDRPDRMPRIIWERLLNWFGWKVFGSRDVDYDVLGRLGDSCRATHLYGGLYKVLVLRGEAHAQG
jgi:ubiquinone/menaquinone biosynthesis C-methylase UbiE